jgi:hypothetical protein
MEGKETNSPKFLVLKASQIKFCISVEEAIEGIGNRSANMKLMKRHLCLWRKGRPWFLTDYLSHLTMVE